MLHWDVFRGRSKHIKNKNLSTEYCIFFYKYLLVRFCVDSAANDSLRACLAKVKSGNVSRLEWAFSFWMNDFFQSWSWKLISHSEQNQKQLICVCLLYVSYCIGSATRRWTVEPKTQQLSTSCWQFWNPCFSSRHRINDICRQYNYCTVTRRAVRRCRRASTNWNWHCRTVRCQTVCSLLPLVLGYASGNTSRSLLARTGTRRRISRRRWFSFRCARRSRQVRNEHDLTRFDDGHRYSQKSQSITLAIHLLLIIFCLLCTATAVSTARSNASTYFLCGGFKSVYYIILIFELSRV